MIEIETFKKEEAQTILKTRSAESSLLVRLLPRTKEVEITQYIPGEPARETVILSFQEFKEIGKALRERVRL